jgi:hypothetical protein
MTWRLHIERTVAKAFRTYLRTYSLFKSERLNTNIKLTLYKDLIKSVMTYGCPTWEYAADARLLTPQRLYNRVLRAIGNLDRRTLVREMHVALKIPYVYVYRTKLCMTQAKVILNHRIPIVRGTGQEEATQAQLDGAWLGRAPSSFATTVQLTSSVPEWLNYLRPNLLHEPALTETLCT